MFYLRPFHHQGEITLTFQYHIKHLNIENQTFLKSNLLEDHQKSEPLLFHYLQKFMTDFPNQLSLCLLVVDFSFF